MNPVTGLPWLAGRIFLSVPLISEISARLLFISYYIVRSIAEINKPRSFKFHPGNRAGVLIWENF